jgi:vanillate O-demethylase monooxygenase subunit
MEYARNIWYPLTWSRDVERDLVSRRIVGLDVVLFRQMSGAITVMLDLCPHRLLPLSMGRLDGDRIECGYHGMTFDSSGRCVRIPGQAAPGANTLARTFPAAERLGMVWVWLGDADVADESLIFDLPQHDMPGWRTTYGDALPIATHYLNLADNLCDPAHVSFVHTSTLGNAASEDIPIHHETTVDGIVVWRWIHDAPPIPLFAKYGNFAGHVDRWHYYHYHAPCIAVIDFGSAPAGEIADEGARGQGLQIFSTHFITPIDDNHCVQHWMHSRNFTIHDDDLSASMSADFRIAYDEDKVILEAIQAREDAYPDFRRNRIAIDAPALKMRRKVRAMIEA